jgi:hypothetical protein
VDEGMNYQAFLDNKAQLATDAGFAPLWMPDFLFDFQAHLLDWGIRKGRPAIFADCGLGKTPMQLVWAENVVRHTNKPVLVLTPLAVGSQTVREGAKFGIECHRSSDGTVKPNITVTNYERLHHFTPDAFAGVVCDESSILKNFDGATKEAVTEFMRRIPYRLLCTATAAPNDYIEFGTSSEALGGLGYMDMLSRFFKNDQNSLHPATRTQHHGLNMSGKWRFKPHAERPFWRWMASWARAVRKPSDLGFHDGKFQLPNLIVNAHAVQASRPLDGYLFTVPAHGLSEQRSERRHTIQERCERVAELADTQKPMVAWCHLNSEGDLLEEMIPDAVQVSGADSDEEKEERFEAFASGQIRCLVTKPVIAGFGLNWQHCAHMTMFPSHSFEQYYQSTRRCWRFGQTQDVTVEIITTEGEADVMQNLTRKAEAAGRMFDMIVQEMGQELSIHTTNGYHARLETPAWLAIKNS